MKYIDFHQGNYCLKTLNNIPIIEIEYWQYWMTRLLDNPYYSNESKFN